MKPLQTTMGFLLAFSTAGVCAEQSDFDFAGAATDLKNLVCVTETPHEMADSTAQLCRPPNFGSHNLHEGTVSSAFCNVYVSTSAKEPMLSGVGAYPEGSLVVKSKLASKDATEVLLYTVMRKMPAGYDEENGNWEYSVIDGRTHRVQARGRIDSCVSCHTSYTDTDYVSRVYLEKPGKH